MPSKRQKKPRFQKPDIHPAVWSVLTDMATIADICARKDDEDAFAVLALRKPEWRLLWKLHGERITSEWIELRPGTRPSHWWKYDAPRLTPLPEEFRNCFYAGDVIESRRLLSGGGIPGWERYAYAPSWHLGIPTIWTGGDVADLVFETQFEYLKRNDLLQPREKESIEPEFVPASWDLSTV